MGFRNVISDGTASPPRFRPQINLQSLSRLPRDGAEWTLAEGLDRILSSGFQGVESSCQTPMEADELAALLHDRNLPLGLCADAAEAVDLLPAIELAHKMRAEYLTIRVPGSLRASPDIAGLLKDMYDLANDAGLPLLIQTQRGSVTQDLRRTVKVIARHRKLRLNADFSGYVLAAELTTAWPDEIWDNFEHIAARASAYQGRITFGEQIQDDISAGAGELAQQFKKLWTLGFGTWLQHAHPGDVLPFTVNLLPPPAAATDSTGREVSDRWEQSLVIKRLAEEAWSAAQPADEPAEAAAPQASL